MPSIAGSTGFGSVLTVNTGGTGLFGNSNLTFNGSVLSLSGTLNMNTNAISNVVSETISAFGPWLPSVISNMTFWFDAQQVSSTTLSNTTVTAWSDRSGLGLFTSFAKETGCNAPSIASNFGGTYRGIQISPSYMKFDTISTSSSNYQGSGGVTLAYMLQPQSGGLNSGIFSNSMNAINNSFNGSTGQGFFLNYNSAQTGSTDYTQNVPYIIIENYSIATSNFVTRVTDTARGGRYSTGTTAAIANSSGSFTFALNGSDNYQNWVIAEIICFNTSLSTASMQQLEGYFGFKYGISLPAGHPYQLAPPSGSSIVSMGTLTTDTQSNLTLSTTANASNIRLQAPTEWRYITSNVSGTTVNLASTSTYYSTLFRLTAGPSNTITFPVPTIAAGVWWTFSNAYSAAQTLTLAGTTTGLTSPYTLASNSVVTFYTDGTSYYANAGGGGGGGSTVSNYFSNGAVLLATGTSTGLQGSSNLFFSNSSNLGIQTITPATALDVNGGVTIRNGYRPLYSNVTTTPLTVAANSYGTHFNITTSTLAAITLPTIVWASDSNAYWVFRNNTGTYLSVTFTYTSAGTTAPTNPVTIPPANSVTMMITYPGGTTSNYVLF